MSIIIHRLLPDTPGSWGLYEIFERRVRAFLKEYLPETNETRAIHDLRVRWIERPLETGFFLAYEHDKSPTLGDGVYPFGHLCSYLADHYGTPYVLFWQIQIEKSPFALQAIREVGTLLQAWMTGYNRILEAAKRPERITYGESYAWIEPETYVRLFRSAGFEIRGERHVFRWRLKE